MPDLVTKKDGPAKEHRTVYGLEIAIETPKGATRSGKNKDGKAWSVVMESHYGYIRRTEGADGDAVDVFLGPYTESDRVFIVNQIDQESGEFDEHKVMLGFRSLDEAKYAYLVNYEQGWRVGPLKEMNVSEFKEWLKDADKTDIAKGGSLVVQPFGHIRNLRSGRCATVLQTLPGGRARLLLHDRGITKPMSLTGFTAVVSDDDDVQKDARFCATARTLTGQKVL